MFAYCPVCKLDMAVRKITVRGLCPDSMFNTVYTLTIMGAGAPRYLGHYTSSIQFDRDQRLWLWLDMKDGESKATRTEYWYLMLLFLIFCAAPNRTFMTYLLTLPQQVTGDLAAAGCAHVWLLPRGGRPLHLLPPLQAGESEGDSLWIRTVHLQWWTVCLHWREVQSDI